MSRASLRELAAMGEDALRPSTFYRSQHPDLFSDSPASDEPILPKDLFIFSLDHLTISKKEREFEDFARRISEREICPNLLPQTGPVGGGDSKTDTSTYPVAAEIAERRWWVGHTKPTNQDWAFAFSCKRDWRTKVKDDVAKIAALPKQFTRIYFITNQPVKDKARAEVEAALKKAHKVDVRILDRTWLVDRVLTNRHEAVAISALGLEIGQPRERRLGPNDRTRNDELEAMLADLRKDGGQINDDYILSQNYLEAAKLASSLERPRDEVDGLFMRSRELALQSGHTGAIIRALYHHAWRTYFWYDDPAGMERTLELMLPYLPGIGDAETCELFSNLCSVLDTANLSGIFPRDAAVLEARRKTLNEKLQAIAADQSRPNNALHAETLLLSWDHRAVLGNREGTEAVFKKLTRLFRRGHGLGTYPILHFMEVWEAMGEFYCDWPGYAELQAEIQRITRERYGDTAAGRRQIQFGWQLLEKNHAVQALENLSAARFLLAKEETFDESVDAALGCAAAYLLLGHVWAARMETLVAGHATLYSLERFHSHPRRALYVAVQMSWIELQLGRIGPFLAWRQFSVGLLNQLQNLGEDVSARFKELERQDGCFACLLLKVPVDDVNELRELADCFEMLGLFAARIALLYICGDVEILRNETPQEFKDNPNVLDDVIAGLKSQPAYEEARSSLCDETRSVVRYEITAFGVKYEFRCRNAVASILVAESVLGMLDAAFAVAKWENFAFVTDRIRFFFDESKEGMNPPSLLQLRSNLADELQQVWHPNLIEWIRQNRAGFQNYLLELLSTLLTASTIDPWKDVKAELDNWFRSGVFDRALVATQNSSALCDLIGKDHYDLNYWFHASPSPEV